MNAVNPPDTPTLRRTPLWACALATLLLFAGWMACAYKPEWPDPLRVEVGFAPANPGGGSQPLVVAGPTGAADFLFMRYVADDSVVFGYDSWSSGGPESLPVKIVPGRRYRLEIVMPGLAPHRLRGSFDPFPNRLRVMLDGATVLDAPVSSHNRDPKQVRLGENPAGGSSCGLVFRGELFDANGRPIRGDLRACFPAYERLDFWLRSRPEIPIAGLLLSALIVWRLTRWWRVLPDWRGAWSETAETIRAHQWFLICAAICSFVFTWVLTGGSFQLIYPESFGAFYDYQASSLIHDRLDVPSEAIPNEAFVFANKNYGYFGPTPALMRIPFVVLDAGFGQLSRCCMLGYYVAVLFAAYRIQRWTHARARRNDLPPSAWALAIFTLGAGLGTTLFFLGSRAYTYHEAILCGAAFALWSVSYALKYLDAPNRRWWLGALVCGTLAIHARPTVGLFALTLLGCIAALHVIAAWRRCRSWISWRAPMAIGILSIAGVLSFNGLSYLKFRSFEGMPLRLNVQYTPERMAHFGGKTFQLCNVRHNFDIYVLMPSFALRSNFPYFFSDGRKFRDHPEAKIDMVEPTLAMPYAMPMIFLLAVGGGAFALWRVRGLRAPVLLLVTSVMPTGLALLAAVVISQRYTADFCPFLIGAAACGLAAIDASASRWRGIVLALFSGLTILSAGISLALTLHYQGAVVWGVQDEIVQRYQHLRARVDAFFHVPTPPEK
jgi:hypothetical protein